jgi:hypothetical protein
MSIIQKQHNILINAYENLKNINTLDNNLVIILANFIDFYLNYWKLITYLKNQSDKPVIKDLITKYNSRKKEIDKILDDYNHAKKNQILNALKKKKSNNSNKAKNLANKAQEENYVENNMTQLQKEFNNNQFLKNLGTNKIQELYKSQNSSNNQKLKNKVNRILNNRAKRLSKIQALELKAKLTNLNEKEIANLEKLKRNNLLENM